MTDEVSSSPERHTFLNKDRPEMDDLMAVIRQSEQDKLNDPEWRKNNMEYDLRTTDWILEKVRSSDSYAQNLYAAMCNMRWIKREMWPLLKEEYWSASWRHSGGIIADMQQKGDYIDWYCSGMGGVAGYDTDEDTWQKETGFVPEGTITEEIEKDLNKLGWIPSPWPEDDNV